MRSGRMTRFGRVHRHIFAYWKRYSYPNCVDEADLIYGTLKLEFGRSRASRYQLQVMHSKEEQ